MPSVVFVEWVEPGTWPLHSHLADTGPSCDSVVSTNSHTLTLDCVKTESFRRLEMFLLVRNRGGAWDQAVQSVDWFHCSLEEDLILEKVGKRI